ncbi:MAG: hypothetical protein V4732_18855 [Pseudomonadota bacterium]
MKIKILLLNIFLVISFANPHFSCAAIIDGYFNGRVYMDESDEGFWSTNPRGKKVSGYFSYDTSLAPKLSLVDEL